MRIFEYGNYFGLLLKALLMALFGANIFGFYFFHQNAFLFGLTMLLQIALSLVVHRLLKSEATLKDQQKFLEEQLVQEAKMSEVGKMMGIITHEINNPIGIIKSQAMRGIMMLEKSNADIETHLKLYQSIKNNTERTQEIIQNMKTAISKPLNQEDVGLFSLRSVIDRAINFLHLKLKKTTIKIECLVSEDDLIYGNFSQLEHVFLNLISNSIDAIKDQENPWIKIQYRTDKNYYYVTSTDSGSGIPDEYLAKINQGFFTSKGAEGSGQGLMLCKKILQNHQGELYYKKEVNTTFEMKLPQQVVNS